MRYAIVDNATLTAIQRLCGMIPIKNKHTIDGDILALEAFIQAVLFYDDLFYFDDYKVAHREERAAYFKYIYPVEFSQAEYSDLIVETQSATDQFVPEIAKKTFANSNLQEFFDLLKMNMTFTWDMSSSIYYLTQKLLEEHSGVDIEKYSKLSTMIFNELSDGTAFNESTAKTPIIYDSNGNQICAGYKVVDKEGHTCETRISKQANAFIAGLSWLDFRTAMYTIFAKSMEYDMVLHPIRQAYQMNFLNRFAVQGDSSTKVLLDAMNQRSHVAINQIFSVTQPIVFKNNLPMFSVWLVNKGIAPSNFMDSIYEVKGRKEFISAREILSNLDALKREGSAKYLTSVNLLCADFEKQMTKLMDTYGINPSSLNPISSMIQVYNLSCMASKLPTLPDFGANIRKPTKLKKLYRYSGFGAVYKAMTSDLSQIQSLGKYHEMITANVWLDENAGYYDIKTEKKEFANAKSYWKIPM